MGGQSRLLPLLIFLCLVMFSTRLVSVATGVSSLSFSAQAEDKAASSDIPSPPALSGEFEKKQEQDAGKTGKEASTMPEVKNEAMDSARWRDAGDSDFDTESIKMELFEDLMARRKKLDEEEKKLRAKQALVEAATQELENKYKELDALRSQIEVLLGKQSEEEKARIESLVKIYSGMKASDAARIFDTLDLDVLVAVVSKMSERKVSPIMAAMNPERARTVTIMLAEQKSLPELPTQ